MNKKNLYLYLSLFGIHVFIALVAFLKFRLDPYNVVFNDEGDGLKNLFTIISYIKDPITTAGICKYNAVQYPFGDYVYYTDNTPLFSIPLRWFCHHVYDVSAQAIIIFNVFIIANILLCGILVFRILRNLLKEDVISYLLALILPWTNIQVMRIWRGHYSLSLSCFVLLAIWLVLLWHKHRDKPRKQVYAGIGMIVLSFLSFLAHGYYLAIITVFISSMLFFYGLYYRKEKYGKVTMLLSVVYAVAAVGLAFAVLHLTDDYLALRRDKAQGYDSMGQKTLFTHLFNHYTFQHIVFPVSGGDISDEPEAAAYLGNVGLYAILIFGFVMVTRKKFRAFMIQVQKDFFKDPLKGAILLGSLVMLFISFGENYYTDRQLDRGLYIINILNPFFYVHQFTDGVEHFRCLARFLWPFYFAFYIWILYCTVAVYREYGVKVKSAIIAGIVFFGGAEVRDYVDHLQHQLNHPNPLSAQSIAAAMPKHIDYSRYQAMLPIPYYIVGAEQYDYVIDDDNEWSKFTYRFELGSGLPLMCSKLSRTPIAYTIDLLDFVANDHMSAEMQKRWSKKPLLVAVNKKMISDSTLFYIPAKRSMAADYYWKTTTFASRNHLQPIDSLGDVVYYEWFAPAANSHQ